MSTTVTNHLPTTFEVADVRNVGKLRPEDFGGRVECDVYLRPGIGSTSLAGNFVKVRRDETGKPAANAYSEPYRIMVLRSDLPSVMAKLETSEGLEELRACHRAFWRAAVAAVVDTMKAAGRPIDPESLPIPEELGSPVNRWVETRWPYDRTGREGRAGNAFFEWVCNRVPPEGRSPEARFRDATGRGVGTLLRVDVLNGEVDTLKRPEQIQSDATAQAFARAMGGDPETRGRVIEQEQQIKAQAAQIETLTAQVGKLVEALTAQVENPAKKSTRG